MNKMIPLGLMGGAALLLIVSLMGPWYMGRGEFDSLGSKSEETKKWGDLKPEQKAAAGTFTLTMILVIVGAIVCLAAAVFLWAAANPVQGKALAAIGTQFGFFIAVAGGAVAAIAVLYFMFALPGSFKKDCEDNKGTECDKYSGSKFAGKDEVSGVTITWGPMFLYYIAVLAALLGIGGAVTSKL